MEEKHTKEQKTNTFQEQANDQEWALHVTHLHYRVQLKKKKAYFFTNLSISKLIRSLLFPRFKDS